MFRLPTQKLAARETNVEASRTWPPTAVVAVNRSSDLNVVQAQKGALAPTLSSTSPPSSWASFNKSIYAEDGLRSRGDGV